MPPVPKKTKRTDHDSSEDGINLGKDNQNNKNGKKKYVFAWKCCLLCTLISIILITVIAYLVINFSVVPSLAQSAVNYTTMDLVNGSISNVTNSSVYMSTTMKIQNTGCK